MMVKEQEINIDQNTVSGLSGKIKTETKESESVQIAILDHSEAQRDRQLGEKINYYAIASLDKIEEDKGHFPIDDKSINKIIKIGNDTSDEEMIKVVGDYL